MLGRRFFCGDSPFDESPIGCALDRNTALIRAEQPYR